MQVYFRHNAFQQHKKESLSEARQNIIKHSQFTSNKTTVFISHKHDDLEQLKGVIGFLEETYNILAYIDSRDPLMPSTTNAETARNIKDRITQCDKFILLATDGAIESKWCNWELGYGDAKKFNNQNIALLPMTDHGNTYKGNEYLEIYPHIVYCDILDTYMPERPASTGYYVRTVINGKPSFVPLRKWLENK